MFHSCRAAFSPARSGEINETMFSLWVSQREAQSPNRGHDLLWVFLLGHSVLFRLVTP